MRRNGDAAQSLSMSTESPDAKYHGPFFNMENERTMRLAPLVLDDTKCIPRVHANDS